MTTQTASQAEETAITSLYHSLLDAWNRHNADDFAACFFADGNCVGFDGSQMNGTTEIRDTLRGIFTDHVTAAYVAKVKEVRFLTPDVAVLRAVSGLVPPGKSDINPATNAIQTLVAARNDGKWQIALFQNTPAQFHGRPELAEALSSELRALL